MMLTLMQEKQVERDVINLRYSSFVFCLETPIYSKKKKQKQKQKKQKQAGERYRRLLLLKVIVVKLTGS